MKIVHDVAVVGLGAHGSAIAAHCSMAGLSVCGIDRYAPPHASGGHHGESRIIRKAYYEDARYVPLLERAYALWAALAAKTGMQLLRITGGLMIGPEDGELFPGALASARAHDLRHEVFDVSRLRERFPAFHVSPQMRAVFEPEAGVLFPEACVHAHLTVASRAGAKLITNRQVTVVQTEDETARIEMLDSSGEIEVLYAKCAVVAVGAGIVALEVPSSSAIEVERQVIAHFDAIARTAAAALRDLPIFAIEERDASFFYGFPDLGNGTKVAQHHGGATSRDDAIDHEVHEGDIENLRKFLDRRLPDANGTLKASATCKYANTVDGHFIIDHRDSRRIVVSACSGHGYKFAPVIGEVVADLVRGCEPGFDLALFEPGSNAFRTRSGLRALG